MKKQSTNSLLLLLILVFLLCSTSSQKKFWGRIIEYPDGYPLDSIIVYVCQYNDHLLLRTLLNCNQHCTTDASGYFSISFEPLENANDFSLHFESIAQVVDSQGNSFPKYEDGQSYQKDNAVYYLKNYY